jgi:hypothetical protein
MSTVVVNPINQTDSGGGIIKGLLDDFEALMEKGRESEDVKTLSATQGDPTKLREAMASMRSKRGKTLALGELGQVPTKLEEQKVQNQKEMIDVYLGRTAAAGERRQEAKDQDVFSPTELSKVKAAIEENIQGTSKLNPGWGKGPGITEPQSDAALQSFRSKLGYDSLGKTQKAQVDQMLAERYKKLNQYGFPFKPGGQVAIPKALQTGQGGVPSLAESAIPKALQPSSTLENTQTGPAPANPFGELAPRLGKMTDEQKKKAVELLNSGVPKEKILEAIDRDLGLR